MGVTYVKMELKKKRYKMTLNMNFGLFACEEIKDGGYIVEYK